MIYSLRDRTYKDDIDRAHIYASKLLLNLLLGEYELMARMDSIKKYFFMEQGDLFLVFMDSADSELRKVHGDVSIERLG